MGRLQRNLIRLIPGSLLPILNEYSAFAASRWLLIASDTSKRRPAIGSDSRGNAVRIPSPDIGFAAGRAGDDALIGANWAVALAGPSGLGNGGSSDDYLRSTAAHVFDGVGKRDRRVPRSAVAFAGFAGVIGRRSRSAAAHRPVSPYLNGPIGAERLLAFGQGWDRIGAIEEADVAFAQLTGSFPGCEEAWVEAAARLEKQGLYSSAIMLLSRAAGSVAQSPPIEQRLRFLRDVTSVFPYHVARHRTSLRRRRSIAILDGLLGELVHAHNANPPAADPAARSLVMINSQLGPGGAERQLMNTVTALQHARVCEPRTPSFDWIKVVAQSCRSRKNDAFVRPHLQRLGVPIIEYEDLPLFGGDLASSAMPPVVDLLRFLPLSIVGGMLRLTDALRQWRPETVLIWQEDVGLEAGLAALVAGVPRIVLSLRSVPSIDRPELFRPENLVILRALAAAHNVILACNSRFAAGRYAEWLAIETQKIAVIPNGLARLPIFTSDPSQRLYRDFDRRTKGSPLTVGVVMRMDDNKRPMLWLETAVNILKKLPSSRFILVGEGPLRRSAMNWTKSLGLADRFLFTGVSGDVAFWLSKMDVFLLVSRQEGLPNVLIEAQLAGVPVVVAAGGGASEALIPGETGIVIAPDAAPEHIATEIVELGSSPERLRRMGEAGVRWATEAFSIASMLRRTLALLIDAEPASGPRPPQ